MADLEAQDHTQTPSHSSSVPSFKENPPLGTHGANDGGTSQGGKEEPRVVPEHQHLPQFQVEFADGDAENPHNFSSWHKIWLTVQMGTLCLTATLATSIITPAQQIIADKFHISLEVSILTVSLFVLGFAIGPTAWAPITEVYGRRWGLLPPIYVLGLFSIGTATSNSAASIFVTRLFGGIVACAPLSIAPAVMGDFYGPKSRGMMMVWMSVAITGGPTLGPVIGSALTVNSHLGWRWTEYIEAIVAFAVSTTLLICLPETYAPVLLKRKAQKMRQSTGDDRYWHPHESEKIEISNVFSKHFSRPMRMFITEPMVTYITLYSAFVYALIFIALEVFPIVFLEIRHYGPVVSTLPFIGILIGVLAALPINLANQPRYIRAVQKNNGRAVPEARLQPMLIGGVLLAAGLFLFGWTAAPKYHWALPVVGGGLFGAGFNLVFLQCLNYLVDTYGPFSASAVSANTIIRSLVAAGLPMAARPMFQNLGVAHAASLLGGISCLALPIPLVFMKYGAKLRARSKFVPGAKP